MRRFQEQPSSYDNSLPYLILNNGSNYFDKVCFLNSNEFVHDQYSSFDWIIALGCLKELQTSKSNIFERLKQFADQTNDWIFGFLTYDIKNQIEKLSSSNPDFINFSLAHFFQPEVLVISKHNSIYLGLIENNDNWGDYNKVWNILTIDKQKDLLKEAATDTDIKPKVDKSDYILNVKRIKEHIQRGNIYEMNYCVEFYGEDTQINPLETYQKLNNLSPAPFSAYYRLGEKHLMSSSPERFIKKSGNKIICQPIKGTIRRGSDKSIDEKLKRELYYDPKERSENVMIVDLVRNDLSKTAVKNSVKVEELYGIYTFSHVHHMISTVTANISPGKHYIDVIKEAFPMGSMTGAPKIRAMEIIEQYESTKRGLYSGCLGYINPDKDFDFNVVIRSILYNEADNYLNYMVGGAITSESVPEKEYEECLLKAKALNSVLYQNKS